jgi:hypothetical protein
LSGQTQYVSGAGTTRKLCVATTTRKFPSPLRSFFDNLLEQSRATAAKLGGEGVQAGK